MCGEKTHHPRVCQFLFNPWGNVYIPPTLLLPRDQLTGRPGEATPFVIDSPSDSWHGWETIQFWGVLRHSTECMALARVEEKRVQPLLLPP